MIDLGASTIAALRRGVVPSRTFLASAAAVLIGHGLIAILGIVALRLYTELTEARVFGTASLILGALSVASQLFVQPIASTQLRFHTEAQALGQTNAFTAEAARWMLGSSLLAAGLAAVTILAWRGLVEAREAVPLAIASALWFVSGSLRQVFMSRLHAEQRMRGYMALRVLEQATTLAATSILILVLAPQPSCFVAGQVASFIVAMAVLLRLAPRSVIGLQAGTPRWNGFRDRLWSYGMPFIPMAALYWSSSLADRYVLAAMLGADAAGKYLAAFTIAASGFGIANGVMGDLFRPKLFAAANAKDERAANRVFLAWLASYLVVSLCGLTAIALLGHWLVSFLIAESYRPGAVDLMLWIAAGFAINGFTTACENRLLAFGVSSRLLLPQVAGALGNVALSYWFISLNGPVGAAQGSCASFALQSVLTALVVNRVSRERQRDRADCRASGSRR